MRKHTNIQLEKLFKTLFREFETAVCQLNTEQSQPGIYGQYIVQQGLYNHKNYHTIRQTIIKSHKLSYQKKNYNKSTQTIIQSDKLLSNHTNNYTIRQTIKQS